MNPTESTLKSRISQRGFGSMDKQKHKVIASKGGKAVSKNREYMAEIGRKGGIVNGARRKEKLAKKNQTNN